MADLNQDHAQAKVENNEPRFNISSAPERLAKKKASKSVFFLGDAQRSALFILTNGDCIEGGDQLFSNDTRRAERNAFGWNPPNLFNIHEMPLSLSLSVNVFKIIYIFKALPL